MKISNLPSDKLGEYCFRQVSGLFPFSTKAEGILIQKYLKISLTRLEYCIGGIKPWPVGEFNILHSSQYCIFLYYLANTIWSAEGDHPICTKLFLLNKALNGIDMFYEIKMPEIFYIGHSVGIVLAKATYGNYLVLYQNSTVGKNNFDSPIIDDGVILYPNTAVIGKSHIRSGSVISQGVSVIDRRTECDKIAYQGFGGGLIFKSRQRQYLSDFFRKF